MSATSRRLTLAAALAAFLACAHPGGAAPAPSAAGAASAPSAKTVPLFEPFPERDLAGVKDPHAFRGKPLCQRCHDPSGKLLREPVATCTSCHRFGHGNHPVNVVQKPPPQGLPLFGDKVVCHSCHDPHGIESKKVGLWLAYGELCLRCHSKHATGR